MNKLKKRLKICKEIQKVGLVTAKLNGKQLGQPKGTKLTTKKSIEAKKAIIKYSKDFNGTLDDTACILLSGVCRNSFYTYKAQLKKEMAS